MVRSLKEIGMGREEEGERAIGRDQMGKDYQIICFDKYVWMPKESFFLKKG